MKKAWKWLKGKKRRIAVVSLVLAKVDPEPYSRAALVAVGIVFGGVDLALAMLGVVKKKG